MKYLMLYSCAIAFGLIAVGREFAPLFFGAEFVECGIILQVLAVSVIFIAWSNIIRTQCLIPLHKDKTYVLAVWIGAILNLALNLLLIPSKGAVGAAIATVITEFVVCVIQTVVIAHEIKVMPLLKNSMLFMVFGTVMLFVVLIAKSLLPDTLVSFFIRVSLGVVVYMLLSLLYEYKTNRTSWDKTVSKIRRYFMKVGK
jgi:O-antigen/teichoic acid export membrane protein